MGEVIPEVAAIAALKRLPYIVIGKNRLGANILTFHAEINYAEIECQWRIAIGETNVRIETLIEGALTVIPASQHMHAMRQQNGEVKHRRVMPAPKVILIKHQPKKQERRRKYAKSASAVE